LPPGDLQRLAEERLRLQRTALDGTTLARPRSAAVSGRITRPSRAGVVVVELRLDEFTPWVYHSSSMIFRVEITRLAEKQLRKLPRHIVDNLMIWVAAVEHDEEVSKHQY
jgi:hypothetical protein